MKTTGRVLLLLCLCMLSLCAGAQKNQRLDSLTTSDKNEDSRAYVNLLKNYEWSITVTDPKGSIKQYKTLSPDTILISDDASVVMTTTMHVSPRLVNHTIAMTYTIAGSMAVIFNDDSVLSTGSYAKPGNVKMRCDELQGFVPLTLRDSVQHVTILYRTVHRINMLDVRLRLQKLVLAESAREDKNDANQSNFSLGFYYLAFSIVFMLIFLFSQDKTETLYFGLFCLSTSFTYLCDTQSLYVFNILSLFCMVFSFEFMSFFLAKVFKNKDKSKISLVVRLAIAAVCFHPAILYNFTFFGRLFNGKINNLPVPLLVLLIFVVLLCISFTSSVYYLIRGFRQKRWEAKTIVAVCLIALFISLILPIIISLLPALDSEFTDRIISMGIYLYPLSAVIVLGRTNRLNQRKLLDQVHSIKQLSEANLEKEKEKQQLLEDQNTDLERKVMERTRDINQQKEELEIKKQEIEIKNKAITDNINYAQRIQSAILPDIKLIYRALANSFILFTPKDIVSGDFYAFAERNDRVLIIAGDCTGHGVSGAFMSMIGSSLLNQIINEKGIEQPDQILTALNTAVIAALKQGENESNDGMDLSLCSFDLRRRELQYAGANRPLWLIRNGEITVYRPDKFPIGGLQVARHRVFTNTTVALEEGDTLYIFTDGYADQFGGSNGKKLMTSKFKEVLLSVQHMSMRQQEHYLRDYFEQWKGHYEQVDDVLVIGVRV